MLANEPTNHIRLLQDRVALTPQEVARLYGCSTALIYKRIREGQLDVIRVGKRIAIPTSQLRKELGIPDPA